MRPPLLQSINNRHNILAAQSIKMPIWFDWAATYIRCNIFWNEVSTFVTFYKSWKYVQLEFLIAVNAVWKSFHVWNEKYFLHEFLKSRQLEFTFSVIADQKSSHRSIFISPIPEFPTFLPTFYPFSYKIIDFFIVYMVINSAYPLNPWYDWLFNAFSI